jgi:putative toxin-antitoxin system antitoxin component (TIGR02293 family)
MYSGFEEAPAGGGIHRIADLLGGVEVLHRRVDNSLEAHDLLLAGLPGAALSHFIDHLAVLEISPALERAMGLSLRTFQRRKDAPEKPLSPEQSGRIWRLAEILAEAIEVLGTREAAEDWLARPARALDYLKPIDLLATPAGAQMVETVLGRLKYGVYT